MKFLLFPVLIWTLATSQLFAQKSLPPSVEDYAVNWSYSVKQMLEAAGYEVPGPKASFDLVLKNRNRNEDLQLDSTVTYMGYQTSDSTPILKVVYTYPQPDKQVIEEFFFDMDHWSPLARTTLTTDDLGRMTETYAERYDPDVPAYVPDSRILFYPHDDSAEEADSFFIYGWAPELQDMHRVFAVWNEFDAADNLQASTTAIELFDVPLIFKDRYHYTPEGDLSLIESFLIDGMDEIPSSREEYFYENQRLSSITTLVSEGPEGFIPEERVTYLYTDAGQVESNSHYTYDFEKNDWKLFMVESFVYDDEGRVINEELVKDDEGIWIRSLTTYDYVSGEYLSMTAEHSYDNNAEDWIVEEKTFYYYNDFVSGVGDEPIEKALFLYPNPTAGIVQVTLPGSSTVYVYTLTEQLIYRAQLPPGEKAIDLSRLPAGLYQVRAINGDEYYSGKLIIQ